MVFDPENLTANVADHGLRNNATTLWSDWHLKIASQGERLTKGLQIFAFLRRPYTEEYGSDYVLSKLMSTALREPLIRRYGALAVMLDSHPLAAGFFIR
jgi:hypothetical protein